VDSTGRCNTIWYNAVFKGGVYDPRETVWAFCGADGRHDVAPLEGGTVVADSFLDRGKTPHVPNFQDSFEIDDSRGSDSYIP
jgi:hypothetical protein